MTLTVDEIAAEINVAFDDEAMVIPHEDGLELLIMGEEGEEGQSIILSPSILAKMHRVAKFSCVE